MKVKEILTYSDSVYILSKLPLTTISNFTLFMSGDSINQSAKLGRFESSVKIFTQNPSSFKPICTFYRLTYDNFPVSLRPYFSLGLNGRRLVR